MYNLDQLLSYLVFITVITFIFERVIENLLIPFLPVLKQDLPSTCPLETLAPPQPEQEVAATGTRPSRRTLLLLLLMFGIGFGLAIANQVPLFRRRAGGYRPSSSWIAFLPPP